MLICAFPGVGKSRITSDYPELFIDLDSGLYSKDSNGVRNPNFVDDYIQAIRKTRVENPDAIILVSTHHEVIKAIRRSGFEFYIVVPELEADQEYITRYKKRGSPPDFIEKIYNNWVPYIEPLLNLDNTIVLKTNEFFSDLFEFGQGFDPLSVKLRRLKNA